MIGEEVSDLASRREIVVNTRSVAAGLTGVQRYTMELCSRFDGRVRPIFPRKPLNGLTGHLWEQLRLPMMTGSRLLWSPANSGPVLKHDQVVTLHDIASLDHPEWFKSRFADWYRWMIPRLVRSVRRVITGSEFTKRRLIEATGVNPSKIVVIPDGVDTRFSPRPPEEVERIRQQLGIPSNQYMLSLGTLEPRKNVNRQLQAWSLSVGHLPEEVWLVVSGAKGKDHVFGDLKLDSLPPRVHFTGFVPDESLPGLYSGAIALLYPSVYEGFGLPALEAMAGGTVPIVGNCTSLPEVVGEDALLVDPLDVGAIAEAITSIVKDHAMRETLRQRGLNRSKQFSWDRTAQLTWQVLEEAGAE